MTRQLTLFFLLAIVCLGGIGFLFWHQELKFTLPTPVPDNHQSVLSGDSVTLPFSYNKKNLFVHFYNYDCPCSRFNIKEFESMVRRYADDVEFLAVLQSAEGIKATDEFNNKYDLGIRVINDPDGEIARTLGVYSTPQAVLIRDNRVFYKGNYNRARFCISRNTKFAEIALQALVNNENPPEFPDLALTAYGCELPSNKSENYSNTLFTIF